MDVDFITNPAVPFAYKRPEMALVYMLASIIN